MLELQNVLLHLKLHCELAHCALTRCKIYEFSSTNRVFFSYWFYRLDGDFSVVILMDGLTSGTHSITASIDTLFPGHIGISGTFMSKFGSSVICYMISEQLFFQLSFLLIDGVFRYHFCAGFYHIRHMSYCFTICLNFFFQFLQLEVDQDVHIVNLFPTFRKNVCDTPKHAHMT